MSFIGIGSRGARGAGALPVFTVTPYRNVIFLHTNVP